ncbi:acetaldehyde dehydrogenase (acetylating) [Niveispirillum fermenti]|uniref:acetaldehyde dehydrogenase (acetylating) n=1 Tax=Niveispirillum fermenti TaxID=1233113 RepID=UPI003A891205
MEPVPLRVALIGAGFIGTDLLIKIGRSQKLRCVHVVGRDMNSTGLRWAARNGYRVSDQGVAALLADPEGFDLVFDATDARANLNHWRLLDPLGKILVNLTPSPSGVMIAPTVNGGAVTRSRNINLISCGGQAAVPIVHALGRVAARIPYIEVVTTAASRSVGQGTRMNLDEFIDVTGGAVQAFSGAAQVKALVNLSPASPAPVFRVAITALLEGADATEVRQAIEQAAAGVRRFCPGYAVTTCDIRADGTIFIAIGVTGRGDRLPFFAGNLDIINDAAVAVAESLADLSIPAGHRA